VVPADQLIEEVAAVSGPLKKYRVVRNGFETVMKLSDEDAAKLGALEPYQVSDAVSTIEPVTAAGDDSEGDDGGDPASPAAAMSDAGTVVSEGMAVGLAETEPVQPPTAPGDDGQAAENPAAPADGQTETPAAAAPETKSTTRKRASSANKARTSAANKADGGS
jgi:hypothetical protein